MERVDFFLPTIRPSPKSNLVSPPQRKNYVGSTLQQGWGFLLRITWWCDCLPSDLQFASPISCFAKPTFMIPTHLNPYGMVSAFKIGHFFELTVVFFQFSKIDHSDLKAIWNKKVFVLAEQNSQSIFK